MGDSEELDLQYRVQHGLRRGFGLRRLLSFQKEGQEGPESTGEPKNFDRIKSRARKDRKRRSMRPPGYGKGGILDPNRVKTPPKRVKEEGEPLDADALLAENKRIVGKSASNLLFALGLFQK